MKYTYFYVFQKYKNGIYIFNFNNVYIGQLSTQIAKIDSSLYLDMPSN